MGGAFPLVGFPLAAAGLAGLIFSGHPVAAALVGGLAVALGTFLLPVDALLLAPAFVAMLFAIGGMHKRSALANTALLTSVLMAGLVARTTLAAWLQDMTVAALTKKTAEAALTTLGAVASTGTGESTVFGVEPEMLVDVMARVWPFDHFANALLVAVVTVAVAGWAAARTGAEVRRLPHLAALDLSVHVLWPLVGAFAFLAAGRAFDGADIATTIGLNLLLGVRLLLLAQGLGVAAAFYSRVGLAKLIRVVGYVLLVVADMMLPLVSMVGLIDFWANFRKLPRDDVRSASGLEGTAGGQ